MGMVAHLAIHSFFDNLFVQGIYLHIALLFAAVTASVNLPAIEKSSKINKESLAALLVESDG
jgi:hypothetical protein